MDRQQIISFIEGQLASGKISRGDLSNIANGGTGVSPQQSSGASPVNRVSARENSSKSLTKVLYIIGAIIAIIGIVILLAQHWDDIVFFGRILSTLGISLTCYITALLMRKPEQNVIADPIYSFLRFGTFWSLYIPVGRKYSL